MKIESVSISPSNSGRLCVSAQMNGERLWFDVPDRGAMPEAIGDSFLVMGLAGSMLRGEPLIGPPGYPVGRELLHNITTIQRILHAWNPRFSIVPVEAESTERAASGGGTACTFSGGVDSICTAVRHKGELDATIFIGGFDFDMGETALDVACARNRDLAALIGLPLVEVYTNQKSWGLKTGVARNFWHSAYLASVSMLLGFDSVLIPSAHSYARLDPSGTHPVLDPLWSNGATRFLDADVDLGRASKMELIARDRRLVERLHVCWRDPVANCGRCDKCLRTMIALEVLGADGPFPAKIDLKEVRRMKISGWEELDYAIDNLLFAQAHDRDDVVRALKVAIRRHDRMTALTYLDRGFLFGVLRKLRMRYRPYTGRVGLTNGRPDLDL